MLVLTRKYQEKIRIGNDITITVLRTKGKAVRLGIEAPSTVPVIRGELQFEDAKSEVAVADIAALETSAAAPARPRKISTDSAWTTKSRPQGAGHGRMVRTAAEVAHRRIPRDKVSQVVPRLVAGTAPLRAMLDQRSASV